MENKETFKKLYGFNSGDIKWILNGGDILRYSGQDVIFVDYKRSNEDGSDVWTNTIEKASIISISDYDPITMTYLIKYTLPARKEEKGEVHEERIIPEGFTFDIMGQGLQKSMHRFTSYSMHERLVEEAEFYRRVNKLFKERDTLPFGALAALQDNKEQSKTLGYAKYIVAAVKPVHKVENTDDLEYGEDEDDLMIFKIKALRLKHEFKNTWRLLLTASDGKNYSLPVSDDETDFYEFYLGKELIGDLKIIDLADPKEEKPTDEETDKQDENAEKTVE